MKHDLKRLTSLLLAVLMVVSMVPAFSIGANAAESTYTKVTTAPADWSGTYLIVYEAGSLIFDGSLNTSDTLSDKNNCKAVTIINNTISGDYSANSFDIAVENTNYSIKSASGRYIGRTQNSAGFNSATSNNYENIISLDASYNAIISSSNGPALKFNVDDQRFRFYTSGEESVALYKLDETTGGGTGGEGGGAECTHSYVLNTEIPATPATCTINGQQPMECELCGELGTPATIPMLYHKYDAEGNCTRCNASSPMIVGDTVHIVYADGKLEYNGIATGETYGDKVEYETNPSSYPLTVEAGFAIADSDCTTYMLKTKNNTYLSYHGSSNAIYEVVPTTDEEKLQCSWIAHVDGETFKLINAANTDRSVRYNTSSPRFACYINGQKEIAIVKAVVLAAPEFSHFSVSLNKGITVNATCTIPQTWLDENAGAYLLFKNGEAEEKLTPVAGENTFKITLKPGEIGNALSYGLYTADDAAVISKDISYSEYVEAVKAAGYANLNISEAKYNALISLFDAIKNYSDAANNALSKDLTETFENVSDVTFDGTINSFGDVSATLGEQADVKIAVNTESVLDTYKLNAKLGGKSIADKDSVGKYITANDQVVINGLYPSTFNDDIVIKIFDGETEVSSLTFTFNAYLKALYNSSADQAVKNLAAATYQYGVAAEAYLAAQ